MREGLAALACAVRGARCAAGRILRAAHFALRTAHASAASPSRIAQIGLTDLLGERALRREAADLLEHRIEAVFGQAALELAGGRIARGIEAEGGGDAADDVLRRDPMLNREQCGSDEADLAAPLAQRI